MIRVLNPNYDLSQESDLELAETMKELCETYVMCRHEISTATCDVWASIVRVAEEIVRRSRGGGDENSDSL
ncbi:MAG: hypothetical protein DRO11_08865 [Methanobacteriota archaeon]|nr:MAG: hypothetical protein DRO11_08865 [Euryarchaeota archaeon]